MNSLFKNFKPSRVGCLEHSAAAVPFFGTAAAFYPGFCCRRPTFRDGGSTCRMNGEAVTYNTYYFDESFSSKYLAELQLEGDILTCILNKTPSLIYRNKTP